MGIVIGRFRIRLELYSVTSEQNEVGEYIQSRTLLKKVWAEFADMSGSETFQANELTANRFASFNVRTLDVPAGFDENCFVKYKGLFYDVVSVKEIAPAYKNITQFNVINKDNAQ